MSTILGRSPRSIFATSRPIRPTLPETSAFRNDGADDRVSFFGADFFKEPLPPEVDLFFISHVIHDWDEEHSLTLLRRCHDALPTNSPKNLGLGEREAIALAEELDCSLLIDDRAGRKEAESRNIVYFGSLRVLKEAKDRGLLCEVTPILGALRAAGLRIGEMLYQTLQLPIPPSSPHPTSSNRGSTGSTINALG